MDYQQLVFSGHAIRQMFHRGISKDDVIKVVKNGQVITDYPEDKPYPSSLIFAFVGDRAIGRYMWFLLLMGKTRQG